MDRQEIIEFCLQLENTSCDYPFPMDNNNLVARHIANKKWFMLLYTREGRLCLNLKCEPMRADFLRSVYRDVVPAYHMNKTHWNTVYADGDVPPAAVHDMICESYALTRPNPQKIKHFVYILQCGDGSYYCGYTTDVARRAATHNAGNGGKYTRSHLPVTVVHTEGYFTKTEALQRECAIKNLSRAEKTALIRGEIRP